MDAAKFENSHPTLYKKLDERIVSLSDMDESIRDPIDAREVFDLLRNISDPEHLLLTLEELNVVEEKLVEVNDHCNNVHVSFTPTIPHCSMAIIIGLCLKVKLMRSLPPKFKVNVEITPGAHVSESAINKQLADKERVMAALEKPSVLEKANQCLTERKN